MSRIRIGVIGCGSVAQIQHLPNLKSLPEEFEIAGVCDISPTLARTIADNFDVPFYTDDYTKLLKSNLDAVILCHSDPKTQVAVDAFKAGLHVLIEKPMCYSLQEADTIIAAARETDKVGMVAYMKVYDPAYEIARDEVARMDSIRFIQVNHLHPDNLLHLRNFRLKQFNDIPAEKSKKEAATSSLQDAIGNVSPEIQSAFRTISGSMIHDIYGLRLMVGQPKEVVSTEIWNQGRAINSVLSYSNGARCAVSWIDLPEVWEFTETLEVYGDKSRTLLSYPNGFAKGVLAQVVLHGIDCEGRSFRHEPTVEWEIAFVRELRHFHACITGHIPCRTPVEEARADIQLVIDIVKAYLTR